MNKRPLSVIIVSLIYIAAGGIGFVFHLTEFRGLHPFQYDVLGIELIRVLAIVSGIYMLRGSNWARWLAIAWISFHVVLGAFHSWLQFTVHALLCAAFAYLLFRPGTSRYFRSARA